jgi:Fe-S-cluster containining protein
MNEMERFKKTILDEYPRLTEESEFCFKCHKDLPCFNACCGDVNIFLTPYDVIRLKNKLGISSGEFLSRYTISPFHKNAKYPVLILKMLDNEKKTCPFVAEAGCTVYNDRPWPCRMYPLGLASPKNDPKSIDKEFYFVLKEDICKGHDEDNKYTARGWLDDQGIDEYNKLGELFKQLTLHDYFEKGSELSPKKMDMFFTVCYNIDKFRNFVFESSFLDKFEIEDQTRGKIQADDLELLKFGYRWLRFALFGEQTLKLNSETLEAARKKTEVEKKGS